MIMKKTDKIDNKLLNNPDNYAAIYARISSKKENNSIDTQVDLAKTALNGKNLLVYGVYTDYVSGHTSSPPDRKGFGKLLEDAKAGCFKTIIAYKHDRIVRNLNDWVNLTAQLRKLNIKIIFSDITEYVPDKSLQGEFLENLIIMVAELEPSNIQERTNNGQVQRRIQGVYNSGKHSPVGYTKVNIGNKIKSFKDDSLGNISQFKVQPLEAIFIQHLYCEVREVLGEETEIRKIKKMTYKFIDTLLNSESLEAISNLFKTYEIDNSKQLINKYDKEHYSNEVIKLLDKQLKEKTFEEIEKGLIKARKDLSRSDSIINIFKNPIYGGYILLDANEEQHGVVTEDNVLKLKPASFIKTNNIEAIIDKITFEKVYSFYHMDSLEKEKEPDFLFKGKLICSNCKGVLHYTNSLLECNRVNKLLKFNKASKFDKCKSYARNSLIESVLDIIINSAFKNSNEGFNSFYNAIDEKLIYLRKEMIKLRIIKISLLKEYLNSKSKIYIKIVQNNQDEINTLLDKIARYANEFSYINKLQQVIENYNNSINESENLSSTISRIKPAIITYIVSNKDIFRPIFDKLIKNIEVATIGNKDRIKCKVTVKYEFDYHKPSNISTRIN